MRGDEEEEAWWPESIEILRMASKRGVGYMEDNSSCSTSRLTDLPLLCVVQDCLVGGGFNRGDLSYNDIRSVVERRLMGIIDLRDIDPAIFREGPHASPRQDLLIVSQSPF
jgi:hypothetical protein